MAMTLSTQDRQANQVEPHTVASQINAMDLHVKSIYELIERADTVRREIGAIAANVSGADGAEPIRGAGVGSKMVDVDKPPQPLLPRITEKNGRICELLAELSNILAGCDQQLNRLRGSL
jgi:hypothetical protein